MINQLNTKKEQRETSSSDLELSNQNQPSYTNVGKLTEDNTTLYQLPYTSVRLLVSNEPDTENFFDIARKLGEFYTLIQPNTTKKLIYLTLLTSRIYSGIAKKTLKITDLQFNRQVDKLTKFGILEKCQIPKSQYDPFIRWVKLSNPNLPLKSLKLYKLTEQYRLFFSKLESDFESYLDEEVVDEIRHYRFAIKRTHRDIQREKRMKNAQQKKLIEDAKQDIYSKIVGNCFSCNEILIERTPSKQNTQTYANYRELNNKLYCNLCYKTVFLGDEVGGN